MPERPRPDIDHTREAMRRHDERAENPAEEQEGAPPDSGPEPAEDDEEDAGTGR